MNSGEKAVNPWPRKERLRLALEGANLGLWDGDIASGKVYWNDQCYRHFGVPVGEPMTHERFLSLLTDEDRAGVERAILLAMKGQEDFQVDYQTIWPDGSRHWIRAVGRVYRGVDGQPIRVSGISQDITQQKQAELAIQALNAGLEERIKARTAELEAEIVTRCRLEEELRALNANLERKAAERTAEILATQGALRESEERYRTIVNNVADAIFVLDLAGNFLVVNDQACRRYGYSREEFLQRQVTAINTPEEAVHVPARLAAVERDGQAAFEAHHQDAQGHPIVVEVRASKILFNGRPAMLSVVRDVTERKKAEAHISYLAYYDSLTGLPNRALGLDRLANQVAHAQRRRRQLAVLYLDLDHFKHINDTYGHLLGDILLQDVGLRLSRHLRAEDSLCRLAADEFMLVLPEVERETRLADLTSLCGRLLALLAEPFYLDGHQVYVGLSIGVAFYPWDGTDGETLMRHADTALYAAKRAGGQTWRFFEPRMNDDLRRFIQTRDALRAALERQEFVLHYQPQIELRSGQVVGVEALLRWQRPGEGLVEPATFLDVAEESGLIVPLGDWVLREACRQAVAWRATGWPDLVVAVNLSASQFRRGQVGAVVLAALAESGLDPAGLELELTESLLLHGEAAVEDTLTQWKVRGIQLALDDFGTGYSCLTYLKRFQFDKVKIDRSFIAHMATNDQDRVIVQTIIDMALGLKLRTIAEGVDDALLASQLRCMGCDEAQGYLYAQPMAARDLERWLCESRQA